jgi:N utilization substance protein A
MSREILLLVDALAREKNVAKDIVFFRARNRLGLCDQETHPHDDADVVVSIDRDSGDYTSKRRWLVMLDEEVANDEAEMGIIDARELRADVQIGDYIEEELEPDRLRSHRRPGCQAGHPAEDPRRRARADAQRLPRAQGASSSPARSSAWSAATRSSRSGRMEAVLPRDQMIPKENLRVGDRVRAFLLKHRSRQPRSRS